MTESKNGISDEERTANRLKLLDEKRNVTGRISDTCRFIGFGLLAVFYAIKTGDGEFAKNLQTDHPNLVLVVGLLGGTAILLDYIQYLAGSFAVDRALKTDDQLYDDSDCAYAARRLAFTGKQLAILLGVVALIWIVLAA